MDRIILWFVFLSLQNYVLSETSSERSIYVTEGGRVTLEVKAIWLNNKIRDVSWITADVIHFATTTPDGNVDIRESRYKGRLRSSNDASLTIINVTLEDQGLYRADIELSDGETHGQLYRIIFAKIPDNNVLTEASIPDPCSVSCRINGSDVILTCDITELYDPGICSCVTWTSDCSRCVLEESCREDGKTDRSRVGVILGVLILTVVLVVIALIMLGYKIKNMIPLGRSHTSKDQQFQEIMMKLVLLP
ncbi:uncharacterized protein LOC142109107 [Mixophyes fleayi]|uniref:uncharacterized protein LOC142109107 n=1 Tax=Mixophyes fleayi TaxID=3061075 RepID=UPI003F4E2F46